MTINYHIIQQDTTGDIYVDENSQYNSVDADNVTVGAGVTVRLFGTIRKKLVIGKGARVYLHGSLAGELENQGGEFYKY
jgi:acetyltransferase-like isoleucine patch superfamily enzyme